MTQEQKNLWIAALRSGKYKQTKGSLKDKTGYCCLGVACEVFNIKISESGETMLNDEGNETSYLPFERLLERSEINVRTFIKMNDKDNCDFNYIADYIEKNLKVC